jgi:hypothetical protein
LSRLVFAFVQFSFPLWADEAAYKLKKRAPKIVSAGIYQLSFQAGDHNVSGHCRCYQETINIQPRDE